MLRDDNYSDDVCVAWLLHDIIEDSDGMITGFLLRELWYSDHIVDLVELCTHDSSIRNSWLKWKTMMDKISDAWNEDALIIKIADLTDNMRTCHLLKEDRYHNFIYKKAPYIMELIYKHLDNADFHNSQLKEDFLNILEIQKSHYT